MPDKIKTPEEQVKDQLKAIKDQFEKSVDDLKTEFSGNTEKLAKIEESSKEANAELEKRFAAIEEKMRTRKTGLSGMEEEAKNFNVDKMVKALYHKHQTGCTLKDAFDSVDAGFEWEVTSQLHEKSTHAAGAMSTGGALIEENVMREQLISLPSSKTPIFEMGLTTLDGLVGDVSIPKVLSRGESGFKGENEAAGKVLITFGEINLRPKRIASYSPVSNTLLHQTSNDAARLITNELGISWNLERHRVLMYGTSSSNEPIGLENYTGLTNLGNLAGAKFTVNNAANMQTTIEDNDLAIGAGSMGFLMRPFTVQDLKLQPVKMYSGATDDGYVFDMPIISNGKLEEQIGDMIRTTTQLTKNGDNANVYYGDWSQMILASWGNVEIKVSDTASDASGKSAFLEDQTFILMQQRVDTNIKNINAFCKYENANAVAS